MCVRVLVGGGICSVRMYDMIMTKSFLLLARPVDVDVAPESRDVKAPLITGVV
jgi:hypothetical protein